MCPATITAISGAAGGISGMQGLGIVSMLGQGLSTMASVNAQKQSMQYQQMQANMEERQYKSQAEAETLQARQQQIDRKKSYLSQLSTNRALMSSSGIEMDSPSYRAFLKANEKVAKKDINAIGLMGAEARLSKLRDAQQSAMTGRAAKANYKSGVATTVGRSLLSAASTYNEFKN
jgi:hypothetical protein